MIFDKGFFKYVKERKDVTKVVLVIALGLILLFLGRGSDSVEMDGYGDTEERLAQVCSSVEGVGECEVMLYYSPADSRTGEEKIESIIVICDGADSSTVRLRLTEMLSSFLGIGANRIRIEKRKG